MKNKILLFAIILFLIFCFVILFKSLNNSNVYVPKTLSEKTLVNFNSKDFFSEVEISSNEIFFGKAINVLDRKFEVDPSIIFIDPPYNKENINLILLKIIKNKLKSKNTSIIIETNKEEKILIPRELSLFKEKIYGKTRLLFLN